MKLFAYDRLATRLVVLVGLGLLLFSLVAGVFTYQNAYRHQLQLAEALQQQLVRTVRDQAAVAAFAANAEIARGVLDGLVASPFVLAARIESSDGFKAEARSRETVNFGGARAYPLLSPVDHLEPIGVLSLVENEAHVNDSAAQAAAFQTMLLLLQVLIGVVVLATILRFTLVNPITRLAQSIASMQPGSATRLEIESKHASDEIGLLASSANALLDAAQGAIDNERSLRSLLEATGRIARVGGWSLELPALTLHWTDETYRLHELEASVPIDLQRATDFYAPDARSVIKAALRACMDHGSPFDLELPILTQRGNPIWVRAQGKAEYEGSRIARVYGALQDITERKLAEAELIAARRAAENANFAKSRFLAAASHDLRQPIQAMNLFHDALARTALSPDQQRISDYLQLSSQSLGNLLNALLDVSMLDARPQIANPRAIRVEELFQAIDAEFSPLALAKSLRFKFFYQVGEMAILTDPKLLRSMLGNLIGNAIKYTEAGGILVSIRRRGDRALIQVWDTGIGIAPENLERIFEEHFQVDNPERDRSKGLGLGLSIVKLLAHMLETDVVCRSRLGRGSVFGFVLPMVDLPPDDNYAAASEEPATVVAAPMAYGGCRAVVIEDDAMVVAAIRLSLESAGLSVTTFSNGEEALASALVLEGDFYISDYRLPGINGVTLLKDIQRRLGRPIKAVVLTGDPLSGQIEAIADCRWPVLQKPIDLANLLAAVAARDQQS